ncbi:hypothetical protein V2O64_15785 [Verrucomicrobiaceae bacterium 227]
MKSKFSYLLPLLSSLTPGAVQGSVTFIFDETTPFDSMGIGASASLSDTGGADPVFVTMTTVDVIGADSSLASASNGHVTNVFGTSIDALGINSAGFNNTDYSNESRDFNPNEGWVFSFNVPITLEEIDFASLGGGSEMTLSSSVFTDLVFNGSDSDPSLGGVLVPAGEAVTLQMTSGTGAGDTNVRLSSLTVAAAVPEAGSATLALLACTLLGLRRRR